MFVAVVVVVVVVVVTVVVVVVVKELRCLEAWVDVVYFPRKVDPVLVPVSLSKPKQLCCRNTIK